MKNVVLLLKACAPSIIKLTFSAITIIIIFFRKRFFLITDKTINFVLAILCFLLCVLCIWFIYSSIVEMFNYYVEQSVQNKVYNTNYQETTKVSVKDICVLVEKNEIIDIVILNKNEKVFIGARSNIKAGSPNFFDKEYYINNTRFLSIGDFSNSIHNYSSNGFLYVAFIDNLKPEVYGFEVDTGYGSASE